jgi:PPOX class probable F420-dependent enzyme
MELVDALSFAAERRNGVLVALKRDGRPQLSNITYHVGGDADGPIVRISITATRAKYGNLVRDPRASLHVSRDDFWGYVVLEGDVELSAVAADPADAAVDELVALYRSLAGEHDDWDAYRAAMVSDQRVVARLRPTRAYGMLGS